MTDDSSFEPTESESTSKRLRRRGFLSTTAATLGSALVASSASAASGGDSRTDSQRVSPAAFDGNEWSLSWSDEFDLGYVDESVWSFETGNGHDQGIPGWGNNELQYYQRENAWVENNHLVIEAREEQASDQYGSYDYTSARMKTQGGYNKQYGRIDVRARLPEGQGLWPAIWALGSNIDSAQWPDCGEIDIMELTGDDTDTVHGTVHGPGYSGGNSIGGTYNNGSFADAYHTFQVTWYPDAIKFFVDGNHYFTVTLYEVEDSGYEWVFDDGPFFFLLNVAVGGNLPGYPDASTQFPQRMEVDYVRVYDWV